MTPDAEALQTSPGRTLVLFNYDWDQVGFAGLQSAYPMDSEGFDLFSFPSNARLIGFDLTRFVGKLAKRARKAGWQAVVSNHEQFGALAAAKLAERMGWPGTPVKAVLACQHKLHARRVLQEVCPQANVPYAPLEAQYGEPIPHGLHYPQFVKPVKAAFSVLAATVRNHAELHAHTRFGAWELWVIRRLVEPFERVVRQRLPEAGSAHRMMIEHPVTGAQYNMDGYVFKGELREIGIVQAVMYPGTDAFMRFDYAGALSQAVHAKAMEVARKFLAAVGFDHGMFNMEFFYDATSDKLSVIEFNPRMASQFSDLYLRVEGLDVHRMALELAWGRDPGLLPRAAPTEGAASSFVYRVFDAKTPVAMPTLGAREAFARDFPDGLLLEFPKPSGSMKRDFKWLGSYRYAIIHLGGADQHDLRQRCERASALFGWIAPYADAVAGAALAPGAASGQFNQGLNFPNGDFLMMNFRSLRLMTLGIALSALAALAGCSAMSAQNPSGQMRPVNAVPGEDGMGLMLKGADVVAYFTMNKYVQGSPLHKSAFQGVTFHFSSAEHKALFDKEPAKYKPQYNGFCANGIAYGIPWGGDADSWRMVDGKLYTFGGQDSRDGWLMDEPKFMKLADGYWKDEVAGNNSFWQRSKRLVFRVPHYMSGEQLAKAVAEAKAKKP